MKLLQSFIFTMFFSISLWGFAAPVEALVTKQLFQSADGMGGESENEAQMAHVKAIMAQAQKDVQAGRLKSTSSALVTYAKAKPPAEKLVVKKTFDTMYGVAYKLEAEIWQLNQAEHEYQQQTNKKIDNLHLENQVSQSKLEKLRQAISLVSQELARINIQQIKTSMPLKHQTNWNQWAQYFAFFTIIFLAILFGFLISRQKKES